MCVVKVWGTYIWPSIQLICFLLVSHQRDQQFLTWSYFKIDLEKSKVKDKGVVNSQGHIVDPVFNQCI